MCVVLRSCGLIGHNEDLSAQAMYERWKKNIKNSPERGDLVFFGKDLKNVSHVAIALNEFTIIESAGGNHLTVSIEQAKQAGACVKLSCLKTRKDLLCVLSPPYPWTKLQ